MRALGSKAVRWLAVGMAELVMGCYTGLLPGQDGDASGSGPGDGSGTLGPDDGTDEGGSSAGSDPLDTDDVPGGDGPCGDGVLDAGEECDQGPANSESGACKPDCSTNVCGDGFVGPAEGCDDGNLAADDGCSPQCTLESCGDGVVDGGEQCDDGQNGDDDDGCTDACLLPACGDGIAQPGADEQCDLGPGNSDSGACTTSCDDAVCGDGLEWVGHEECDLGAGNGPGSSCTPECSANVCGDGYAGPGEQCDDGNASNVDDCTNVCQGAACGDGYTQPGEQCDDGNANDLDVCSNACVAQMSDGFPNNAYCDQVAGWGPAWTTWELEVLALVNEARSTPTDCGSEGMFGATGPLTYDGALTCAARNHSQDMGDNDYFAHTSPTGETPSDRLALAGYSWSTWGENIGAGYSSPTAVVDGWLASDGHCANIMNPAFQELGVGYYAAPGSTWTHYWTQNFGAP